MVDMSTCLNGNSKLSDHLILVTKHIKDIKKKTMAEGKNWVSRGKTGVLRMHVLCAPCEHLWFMGWGSEKAGVDCRLEVGVKETGVFPRRCPGEESQGPCHFLLPKFSSHKD